MWAKLSARQQVRVLVALKLFTNNQHDASLRVHQLKSKYYPQYSLSVSGDLRVHYARVSDDRVVLMMVGTHSQLYG